MSLIRVEDLLYKLKMRIESIIIFILEQLFYFCCVIHHTFLFMISINHNFALNVYIWLFSTIDFGIKRANKIHKIIIIIDLLCQLTGLNKQENNAKSACDGIFEFGEDPQLLFGKIYSIGINKRLFKA